MVDRNIHCDAVNHFLLDIPVVHIPVRHLRLRFPTVTRFVLLSDGIAVRRLRTVIQEAAGMQHHFST